MGCRFVGSGGDEAVTIGARVLKTGIAVAFAIWVGSLVGLNSPLLAAIAAIFTIQPSIYRSWKQVLDQVQSNLMGAAIAIAAVWLVGASPIAVGITCVCVILLCLRIGTEETIGLTLVTVVVVMEAGVGGSQGWVTAADRLGAIMTGIASAFIVNVAIAPPRHAKRFVKQVQEAQAYMSRLLRTAVSNELRAKLYRTEQEELRSRIRGLEEFHKLFAEERVWRRESRRERVRLLVVYKSMLTALSQGSALISAIEDHYFAVRTAGAWNRLIERQIETLCGYHEQLLWKWAGHIKPGATAHAPPPEASALLTELIAGQSEPGDSVARAHLFVVASAVFQYEDRLRRLDKLMSHYLGRKERRSARLTTPRQR